MKKAVLFHHVPGWKPTPAWNERLKENECEPKDAQWGIKYDSNNNNDNNNNSLD